MSRKEKKALEMPTADQLQAELQTHNYRRKYSHVLRNTIFSLIIVAAAAVLISTMFMPVLQITGSSMTESMSDGDIVIALSNAGFETGDIVAFYYNNDVLVKRVIASAGQWVDIDDEGNVYVDGVLLDEPYVNEKALGECNIELPYQVPDGRYFVMGDHRSTSIDSRNTAVGCISDDMVIGRIILRLWPFDSVRTY